MTALSSPPISPESPLTSALQARTVRSNRADPAPSFDQILSDKTDPAAQRATDEAPSEPKSPAEDQATAETSDESPDATTSDPAEEADADPLTDATTEAHEHAWRAARTDIRAVALELTNAASVDLAALAAKELSGRKQPAKSDAVVPTLRGPDAAGLSKPRSDDPTTNPDPAIPSARSRSQTSHTPSTVIPTDAAHPRTDKAATPDAGSRPAFDQPDTAQPVSAAVAQQKSTEPRPHADVIAASRQSLLDRLSGSAEARRGAVASVDRLAGAPQSRTQTLTARPGPAGTEPSTARREQILAPVQRGLASMMTQGGGRMSVILRPEHLGEVRLSMQTSEGSVRVHLEASTEAARSTLESEIDTLRAGLEARGVRVESLTVDHTASANQPGTPAGSQPGDQGSSQQQRPDRQSAGQTSQSPSATIEAEPVPTPRGIWTELGIDALA
jgi:flagellar hook-length control protein FliK